MTDQQISSRPSADAAPGGLRSLGLDRNPFAGRGGLVPDASRRAALATLQEWINASVTDPGRPDRLAVLTAEPEMGKSSLLRRMAAETVEAVNAPLVDPGKGGLTDAQLLRAIIDAFGGTATGRTGMDLRRDIRHAIADLPQDVVPGLLIDDADYRGSRLELLRNVLHDSAGRGLFIVLTGQPDLADRLARRRSFRAILGPSVHIDPMDASSLGEMISSRADTVPRTRALIAKGAIDTIVEQAEGNPGRLLRLAELAVEAAARQGVEQVDRSAVIVAVEHMKGTSGILPDAGEPTVSTRSAIQAEIPLLAGGERGRTASATRQGLLWDGGTGDDQVPV